MGAICVHLGRGRWWEDRRCRLRIMLLSVIDDRGLILIGRYAFVLIKRLIAVLQGRADLRMVMGVAFGEGVGAGLGEKLWRRKVVLRGEGIWFVSSSTECKVFKRSENQIEIRVLTIAALKDQA